MQVFIQKHRNHPIWKFYDEKKSYLGQILGRTKEDMPVLAKKISELLLGAEDKNYKKESLSDGRLNILDVRDNFRVAGIEKDFTTIGKAIQNNLI